MADAKVLYLLRHAKSSWDDPELDDHDRPLAPRGHRAAKLIGSYLRSQRIRPSLVLCSSARRARETLELVLVPGEVLVESPLYGASADQLLARLRRVPARTDAVMLVGHNPSIQDLAAGLTPDSGLAACKYPTAALATLLFAGNWRELGPGGARLVSFVTPRELERR